MQTRQIVRLSIEDAAAIAGLENVCFPSFERWNEKMLADSFVGGNTFFFGAKVGEMLVGYVSVSYCCGEAELLKICVVPQYRRLGIAKRLVGVAIDSLRAAYGDDFEKIVLEVAADNFAAQKLYETYGFSALTTRKGYYRDATHSIDAVIMIKTIK